MDKEFQAYEELWEKILEIEDFCSSIIFFDAILLESEYNLQKSYELLGRHDESRYTILSDKKIEKNRIYISDKLYQLFFSYRAILLRSHFLYHNGRKKGNIMSLKEDKGILQHIKQVLTEGEIEIAYQREMGFIGGINDLLKEKILLGIKNIKENMKQEKTSLISAGTYIRAGGDIIVGNQIKNSHSNNEKSKSWQDNMWLYLIVGVLIGILVLIISKYFKI